MKSALFAALLLAGSAAFAQTTPMPDATAPAAAQPDATPAPAPMPSDQATSPTVMPDNSAPQTDNNGNTVISAPAQAPAGFNQAPGSNGVGGPYVDPSQAAAPMAATGTYPACSRTVTDHCVQNYERGVRHSARRHS